MLGSGYLHVQNSKMTAQVHLYQLCEYKRMMHQAMYNILHQEIKKGTKNCIMFLRSEAVISVL